MSRSDNVFASYQKEYDRALSLYDNDQLDETVEVADRMLDDTNIPRYHRIKCCVLIAGALEDTVEAQDLVEQAESEWWMERQIASRGGSDADTQEALAELREDIDIVKGHVHKQRQAFLEEQQKLLEMEEGEETEEMEVDDAIVPEKKTGAEPLYHHRHNPGSVRLKKQASRLSILPGHGSPDIFSPNKGKSTAAFPAFRSPIVVPVKKEEPEVKKEHVKEESATKKEETMIKKEGAGDI